MVLINFPGENPHKVCEDALSYPGMIVTLKDIAAAGNCKLADAAGEPPYGVATESTVNRVTGTAEEDKEVGVQKEGVCNVRVELAASRSTDIKYGDYLQATANGTADYLADGNAAIADFATMLKILGRAEEALAATVDPADQMIAVRLCPQGTV